MQLSELKQFASSLGGPAAAPIQRRLCSFLDRMLQLGLGHLTVLRSTTTLSGGELRRIRIANQLNSPLAGLMYIVDEASAGLHYEEARPVYAALSKLRDAGNTVVLVDHSDGARNISDYVIELGPGGGSRGGRVMWAGTASEYPGSHGLPPTVERSIRQVGPGNDVWQIIARSNNLHGQTVRLPRNRFVVLVGPSGAGKSSLAVDISAQVPDTVLLSQRDIGRSVRSVLATYLSVFDAIRRLFGAASGRSAADFSFNGAGACPNCGGWGYVRIDMQFLEDVTSVCDECGGLRYRPEVMNIRVRGLTIAEVLDLTIDEAAETFRDKAAIYRPLRIAAAVGIGHLVIGQSTDTLSGGEAQRLRVAAEVARPGRTLLILDEPTRGLGHDEVPRFIELVDKILDEGRSVIAIEHNLPVIRAADWVIELGPGGGSEGGRILAEGTPAQLVDGDTLTGRALRRLAS
jgi:excinuclease UvrABC ATPase subunit